MDPAKKKLIIKNILIIITTLVFFGVIGYGIYSVLKSTGINIPICASGQTNYPEYDNSCYEECNDDYEPCPYIEDGDKTPKTLNCVPKCKDSDIYDFNPKYCNNYNKCSESEQNCKYYCDPSKSCKSGDTSEYSEKDGWRCVTPDKKPQFINCPIPSTVFSSSCDANNINIGDDNNTCTKLYSTSTPTILINNTNIKFDITLYYTLSWVVPAGGDEAAYTETEKNKTYSIITPTNSIFNSKTLIDYINKKVVNKYNQITTKNIAPADKKANDFLLSDDKQFSSIIFYNISKKDDEASLQTNLIKSINTGTYSSISLVVYNDKLEQKKPSKDASPPISRYPLNKGWWQFKKFGCKVDEATEPVDFDETPGPSNLILFQLEDDPYKWYFGIVTTSDNVINKDVYIGNNGMLYFGDYCKLLEADCDKLGIPNDLKEADWNVSS